MTHDYQTPFIVKSPSGADRSAMEGAYAGDIVECPNGHKIAEIGDQIWPFEVSYAHKIKFLAKGPEIGTPREACRCPQCDAIWLHPQIGGA